MRKSKSYHIKSVIAIVIGVFIVLLVIFNKAEPTIEEILAYYKVDALYDDLTKDGEQTFGLLTQVSPDSQWIVFCKAKSYMLLQPDSELYIIPAEGGGARRLWANTSRRNSWHSFSPNGKWLVFSSKANSPYTQLFPTYLDEQGHSSQAVLLEHFTSPDRAANIPEFVNVEAMARQGKLVEANEHFMKVIKLESNHIKAHGNLGSILLEQGAIGKAMDHLFKAVHIDPNNVEAHYSLALALADQRRLDIY